MVLPDMLKPNAFLLLLIMVLAHRLAWALVHSQRTSDVRVGLDLAEQLVRSTELDAQDHRDLIYMTAVAQYRLGNVLDARRQLDELLKVAPSSRQFLQLKEACEQQIVKEGLVGIGIGSAILGIAAVAIGVAFGARLVTAQQARGGGPM